MKKMKEMVKNTPKPVLHGVLLGNGTFVTPKELKFLERFGLVNSTKL